MPRARFQRMAGHQGLSARQDLREAAARLAFDNLAHAGDPAMRLTTYQT
jgi:hypothetical protein